MLDGATLAATSGFIRENDVTLDAVTSKRAYKREQDADAAVPHGVWHNGTRNGKARIVERLQPPSLERDDDVTPRRPTRRILSIQDWLGAKSQPMHTEANPPLGDAA